MNVAAPRVWAAVPAAGSGSRMGAPLPKQYLPLAGRPLALHTLNALLGVSCIREIVVALAPGDRHWASLGVDASRVRTVQGGEDRAASVLNALHGFSQQPDEDDWVLVHDMARPCVRRTDIERLVAALAQEAVGGLLALPVAEMLKRGDAERRVVATLEREGAWQAQTPQMFRYSVLLQALEQARDEGVSVTDESMAVERLGLRPRLVEGGRHNIKLTRAEDMALAEFYIGRGGADAA